MVKDRSSRTSNETYSTRPLGVKLETPAAPLKKIRNPPKNKVVKQDVQALIIVSRAASRAAAVRQAQEPFPTVYAGIIEGLSSHERNQLCNAAYLALSLTYQ